MDGSRSSVRDRATNRVTPCRINVVGPDGDFYQPAPNRLSPYSLTGQWPETGKGKPAGQRTVSLSRPLLLYDGRDRGRCSRGVRFASKSGKDFQYQPVERNVTVDAGETVPVSLELERSHADGGDGLLLGRLPPAFSPQNDADDQTILDLLEAEDIQLWLDPGLQRAAGPVHRVDGDDGLPPASGTGSRLGEAPRRDLDRLRPGISQHDLWASESVPAR